METIYIAWRKCVRKIFSIPYNTHRRLVHLISDDISIGVKLHKRFLKFFINLCDSKNNSKNNIVRIMAKLAKYGSSSKACSSLNYVCSMYNLDKYRLSKLCLKKVLDDNDRNDVIIAGVISDFLDIRRSDPTDTGLTDIIDFLCTS